MVLFSIWSTGFYMSMYKILMCEFLKHLIRNNACKTAMIINGPHELTGERNYLELPSSFSIKQETTSYHTVIGRRVDCIQELAGQWLYQETDPKHIPRPNLPLKIRLWSLIGHLMPITSTTTSWTPGNNYIWEVCSENWRDKYAQKCSTYSYAILYDNPHLIHMAQCFKSWTSWAVMR